MDRREVEHVEAEILHPGQLPDDVVEGAVDGRVPGLRAREELVPGREPGGEPVGHHLEHGLVAGDVLALGMAVDQRPVAGLEQKFELRLRSLLVALQAVDQLGQRGRVRLLREARGRLGEAHALDRLEADVHARGALLLDLVQPGGERVAPALDRVLVAGVPLERETPRPAVVVDEMHRRPAPFGLARGAIEDLRRRTCRGRP